MRGLQPPDAVPIPGSESEGRILENLGAWNVDLTDAGFAAPEQSLNCVQIYGHRGSTASAASGAKATPDE